MYTFQRKTMKKGFIGIFIMYLQLWTSTILIFRNGQTDNYGDRKNFDDDFSF